MLRYTRVQPGPATRVLEAGCGTAMYGLTLARLGFTVDAFDYNEEALIFARKLYAKVAPNADLPIRLYCGNLLNIDSKSGAYDLVFNQAVLEYFTEPDERARVLAEMARVAKPGGWIALIVQHTGHPFRRFWERLGWSGYTNQPATTRQTPDELEHKLRQLGLVNVNSDGLYPWKAFFFYPDWHRRWKLTENLVYLVGQALHRGVPLPRAWRKKLGLQFLAIGQKPPA